MTIRFPSPDALEQDIITLWGKATEMSANEERCRQCGATGPGQYADMIMVPMLPQAGEPPYTHETVFYCAECVREMEEERALERELMKDPEYAAEVREFNERHAREFREALENNGIKMN